MSVMVQMRTMAVQHIGQFLRQFISHHPYSVGSPVRSVPSRMQWVVPRQRINERAGQFVLLRLLLDGLHVQVVLLRVH
ncbi:MAG: hypothetical protein U0452_03960 [Anaerolineae bacterium]